MDILCVWAVFLELQALISGPNRREDHGHGRRTYSSDLMVQSMLAGLVSRIILAIMSMMYE